MGRICSKNYWSEDGKLRQKILLKCSEIERLPSNDQQSDLNRVRLFAQISSKIQNTIDNCISIEKKRNENAFKIKKIRNICNMQKKTIVVVYFSSYKLSKYKRIYSMDKFKKSNEYI
jgi:hypothetical protein